MINNNGSQKIRETEDRELEELAKEYLDLEEQRNENIDKLEEINKKLVLLYSELEKN